MPDPVNITPVLPTPVVANDPWRRPPGFWGWLASTDHKDIGRRFIATAFGFFAAGGVLAALMRLQLARPEAKILNPDLYNQIFSMHGTTMMFLFAVPIMEAIGIYLVPLMVGARNIAFPRLNACSYYIYLFGGLMLYGAFLMNTGVETGWFSYVPLAGPDFSPGKRTDFWAQLVTFTELSAIMVSINLIVTTLKLRAPGMGLNRMPLFVWGQLVTGFMVLFAMPVIAIASTCLILDRLVGTQFFNVAEGGDALLWQHLFWFFGHPEVYIIFLPATGLVSAMLPALTRRPVFGHTAVVLALVATAFMGFGLWVHHMFATGLPRLGQSFFTAASMLIALPSGTQIFCWLVTLWTGRLQWTTALRYILGFFFTFVLGGLTGVMLAAIPFDLQAHDSFFVVAHFHYVLIGGAVFPLLGAVYHWFPKVYGRMLDERLGRWNFWLVFAGFQLTFFPQHLLGLQGMPRRVYTYRPETGWGDLNLVSSIGALILAVGLVLLLVNIIRTLRHGAPAPENPWGADGLEWGTSSPPPPCNFPAQPVVHGRQALWEPGEPSVVTGLDTANREILVTGVLDAAPDHRVNEVGSSIWPFWAAVAISLMLFGSIFTPWAIAWGSIPVFVTLVAWFWPKKGES
jgi:cytochrome c oxidase subunit I+III